ncbi:hypothetical protein FOZ76_25180 [Verticiella sediminum]|uniref:Uncharacterized protein n=1 Tax=Verticiella sediminum TaxID=1247510 RepID=A0A556A7Q6_9BURK|nr:hypothetical protein [Verticiella sediminum]TSH88928.1 hypothetical protein FOZ76_25180 [Verticiella sediminum]
MSESLPYDGGYRRILVGGLLRLEAVTEPLDLPGHITGLNERLRAPEHASLRRALTVYVNRVIVPSVAPELAVAGVGG